jgi:aldehyde dehydrogenase (NAD+)
MQKNTLAQAFQIYEIQSAYQKKHGGIPLDLRLELLKKLQLLIEENRNVLYNAVRSDLSKSDTEFSVSEITPVIHEIKLAKKNLKKWTRPVSVPRNLIYLASKGVIRNEPKGAVLIISPWNFPITLTLGPVASAIAAGNSITVKPSEFSPATSETMQLLINENFDPAHLHVVTGEADTAVGLLSQPYNHVFFTGSPSIGKKVMKAASVHLASVTLELGGKSPAIIDDYADIDDAAAKITAGKFLNCGQTCIAPDYVLIEKKHAGEFVKSLKKHIDRMYRQHPDGIQGNPDYPRIVNERHYDRLKDMLDEARKSGARIETGGSMDRSDLYIEPVVITGADPECSCLQEEIFGPILPVITFESEVDVAGVINSKPVPLALYIFSDDRKKVRRYLNTIKSGTVCINEVLIQFLHLGLPFGGHNNSGIGNAHGYYGFRAFSQERAVLRQPKRLSLSRLLSPPYSGTVKKLVHITEKYL